MILSFYSDSARNDKYFICTLKRLTGSEKSGHFFSLSMLEIIGICNWVDILPS